uniref:G-protein coupled receptors family 1 profile domain-containing protein n=1 Tax=Strigamia maritima TaxID=126957 RepID=T1J4R3_STRMM
MNQKPSQSLPSNPVGASRGDHARHPRIVGVAVLKKTLDRRVFVILLSHVIESEAKMANESSYNSVDDDRIPSDLQLSTVLATWIPDATVTRILQDAGGRGETETGWRIGDGGMGLAAIFTSLILVGTATGNILVCLAICLEKRLHNMTNYFLLSLAMTDLMVAVSVMPLGIITINEGYFPLPSICCFAWVLLDVLFCTCSIMHLCTISVDRYLSLRYPMRFGRIKTKRRVVLKICFVWILSIAMSLPIAILYARDEQFVLRNGACYLHDPMYVTIGSIVCFFIPLIVMMATYALTINLLNKKAVEVHAKSGSGTKWESGKTPLLSETTFSAHPVSSGAPAGIKRLLSKTYSSISSSTTETDMPGSSSSTGGANSLTATPQRNGDSSSSRSTMVEMHFPVAQLPARKEVHAIRKYSVKCKPHSKSPGHDQQELWLQLTTTRSGKDYTSTSVLRSTSNPDLSLMPPPDDAISVDNDSSLSTTSQSFRDQSGSVGSRQDAVSPQQTKHPRSSSQPCMRKWAARNGRFLRAERKASKVLGVVFFTFVMLWCPFFLLNLLSVCKECVKHISPPLQDTALWLGYASSMVNPIFYTAFNKTFRQTFVKILKCQWKEIK